MTITSLLWRHVIRFIVYSRYFLLQITINFDRINIFPIIFNMKAFNEMHSVVKEFFELLLCPMRKTDSSVDRCFLTLDQ